MLWLADEFRSNVSEYVLILWQTEDLLRGLRLDHEEISSFVHQAIDQGAELNARREIARLVDFSDRMVAEKVQEKGHLSDSLILINNLDRLYTHFANEAKDEKFIELYAIAQPNIKEFKKKSQNDRQSDIEACFVAIYAFLLMKLKKQRISPDTDAAMKSFSDLLAFLSVKFNEVAELN